MKRIIVLILALATLASLAACGGAPAATTAPPPTSSGTTAPTPGVSNEPAKTPEPAGGPKRGGVIRYVGAGDTAEEIGLPQYLPAANTTLLPPWCECLLLEETDGTIHPFLAESWDIKADDAKVIFKLREDVNFHDGSKFNAEVAKWNIDLMIETKIMNPAVIGAEATGEYELTVLLNGYTNAVLPIFASHSFCFVSKENFDKLGTEEAKKNPVGTGPFTVKEKVNGLKIVYERFDGYWQEGKPYLDGIEFVQIGDVMTQNAAVMSTSDDDRIDMLNTAVAEQVSTLANVAPVYVNKIPTGQMAFYPASLDEKSPLHKLEVRQAISFAIDRESLCEARGFGISQPAKALIPPPYVGNFGDENFFSYDPDRARELLKEAGYPDGFSMNMYKPETVDADTMVAIVGMLGEVGIKVNMDTVERGKATELRTKGWDGLYAGTFTSLASMSSTFRLGVDPGYQFYPSMWRPAEEMLEPYEAARKTIKCEQEMFAPLHKMMLDYMVVIPVYTQYNCYVINNRVHDSGWGEWGVGTMFKPWDAWVD